VFRTRVLTDDEIRILITGFDTTRYAGPVRLLFLTGLRRDEVLGLQWRWVDLEHGIVILPPEAEKTGARGKSFGTLRSRGWPSSCSRLIDLPCSRRGSAPSSSSRRRRGSDRTPTRSSRSSTGCAAAARTACRRHATSGRRSARECCPTTSRSTTVDVRSPTPYLPNRYGPLDR
jgi:integrase